MFFSRKPQPPIRTLVGEGTILRGELRFSDGLRIDGEIHGDVIADPVAGSLLVISEKARVHGKVNAAHVIIGGSVRGAVGASETLELQPRASVVGDVRYEVLEMHPGATIDGKLQPLKPTDKPALKLAVANDA
jgi:cytoskeletal protein CcmA (bactofilin family)